MQQVVPNLWFDGNAKEAVDFYVSVFPGGKIVSTEYYPESEEDGLADFQLDLAGQVLTIEFELNGYRFVAINAGPEFECNPSISFMVNFDLATDDQAREQIDDLWERLASEGEVLMPIDEYAFSKRYGWVSDRYGVSWQLSFRDQSADDRPFIVPSLLFTGDKTNKAAEALEYYASVFKDSSTGIIATYPEDTGPAKAGSLMYGDIQIGDQFLAAMDSGVVMDVPFNEAVSLAIMCEDQAEIDYFWERLSAVPEAEQCGWCKDKFGVSWQVTPKNTEEYIKRPGAFGKLMEMKKIIIADF